MPIQIMNLDRAYLLHAYPYKETSALVKLLTENHGVVTAIARGVKRQGAPWRGLLQPFHLLHVGFGGRGDVKTLHQLEALSIRMHLPGSILVSGLYLNEILLNLLPIGESHSEVFTLYEKTLVNLSVESDPEPALRVFEMGLLHSLGYLPHLLQDVTGEAIEEHALYTVYPEQLPERIMIGMPTISAFSGKELIGIASQNWQDIEVKKAAKRLLRNWIAFYCKGKPLKSRELFC